MEILDLYDDNGIFLNETIFRGEKVTTGKNIMLSVIFIKNIEGKYLIQKTSKEKGGKFSSTGGHVIHGEDGFTTIIRELYEELGLKVDDKDVKYITTFKYPSKTCIFNVYELEIDNLDLDNIKLQESEVESINFLSKKEIEKIITDGNFLESHAYIFKNYILKKSII